MIARGEKNSSIMRPRAGTRTLKSQGRIASMSVLTMPAAVNWSARRDEKKRRMESIRPWMDGQVVLSPLGK